MNLKRELIPLIFFERGMASHVLPLNFSPQLCEPLIILGLSSFSMMQTIIFH